MPFSKACIVLLGPKHSGKTSAGRALAVCCRCPFIDLDELIEQRSGKSPRALYTQGPEIFKQAEAEALAAAVEQTNSNNITVIAAGGGIVDNPAALALLNGVSVLCVYIKVSTQTAWERITQAGELPPFLRTENPQETHRSLHERRSAAYQTIAGLVIDAEGKSPQEIAEKIVNCL